jgi:peptide/nickel transport system ATP-binding protein
MSTDNLLTIKDLRIQFPTRNGYVTAVDEVSFSLKRGEVVGIVGESGCGKSVTALSITRLLDEKGGIKQQGEIYLENKDIFSMCTKEIEKLRGNDISFIFQDPMSSLNPCFTVGNQISEVFITHQKVTKKEALKKSIEMLSLVGIPSPEKRVHEFPHQLSGGMRQRVMIAMALACQPKLLIADEPTTALDVTIQAQILNLMLDLKEKFNTSILMITHDLGVVAEICSKVVIMYLGQVIEEADVETTFSNPCHPYTVELLKSIPKIDGDRNQRLNVIKGIVPSLHEIPKGCRFAPRCSYAKERCWEEQPQLESIDHNHSVRCWFYKEIKGEVH